MRSFAVLLWNVFHSVPHFIYRAIGVYCIHRAFTKGVDLARRTCHHHVMSESDIYRDSIFWVEVERIKPNPFQPRREFDESKLNELAESIRMYGLLQPLTVTRHERAREDGAISVSYELIAGERRLRASKIAGLSQVPVIIRTGEQTDQMKLELAIIENLQREDLNPIDRAVAFQKLYKEFSFTHIEIGKKVGKSREYVSNTIRLLSLPENMLTYLAEGRISEGHARPLMMLNDRPEEQAVLAKEILLRKLTVRESEALARRAAQDKVSAKHKINPEILELERSLTERLGTRVTIEPREVGGRVVISFFSPDDLEALLKAIQVEREGIMRTENVFSGEMLRDTVEAPSVDVAVADVVIEEALPREENADIVEVQETNIATPHVAPSDERPLPEAENKPEQSEADRMSAAFAMLGMVPQTHAVGNNSGTIDESQKPEKRRDDDEDDLYSLRNFSI
jgi:ParB family transcriptional regulator, chromosome partitioning protein